MLLMSPNGNISRKERFRRFATGDLLQILADEFKFAAARARAPRQQQTWDSLRASASAAARRPGGLTKLACSYSQGPNTSAPRTAETRDKLDAKHPAGDDPELLQAEVRAGLDKVHASGADGAPVEPATLTAAQVRVTVMKSRADAAPGLSGLRILHMQQIVRVAGSTAANKLLGLVAWLGTAAYSKHEYLPAEFWQLHMAARLSAVGEKARPIACGDTARRIFGATYCRLHRSKFAALFEGVHQLGVGTSAGTERLATAAQLVWQGGGVVLALDGRNAFNAASRRAIFREVAKHAPDLYAYVKRMYGPEVFATLVFGLDGVADPAFLYSRQGVQQGDNLGPMLFALALLPLMREFKESFPDVALPGYLDDLALLCRSGNGLAADLSLLREAFAWVQLRLAAVGIEINMDKTWCLLPADAVAPAGVQQPVAEWASAELGGVQITSEEGLVLAGVPIGSPAYVQRTAVKLLRSAESDRLVGEIAGCRDTQLAFTLLRLCYLPQATYLSRNVGPSDIVPELAVFDAKVIGAFAALIQEPLATGCGAEADDWAAFLAHVSDPEWDEDSLPVSFTPLQQRQVRLRQNMGGFGLSSHVSRCNAAFMGRMVHALPLAYAALPTTLRDGLRDCLLDLPLLQQTRSALLALRAAGVTDAQLIGATPEHWTTWAFAEDQSVAEAAAAELLLDGLSDAADAGGMRRMQAQLCRHLDALDLSSLQSGIADAASFAGDAKLCLLNQARFRSQGGKGAQGYLSVAPSNCRELCIIAEYMREACRRGLGIDLPEPGGLCYIDACAARNAAMTAMHVYANGTCRNGEQNFRHHALRDLVLTLLSKWCKVPCKPEDHTPFVATGNPLLAMDVVGQGGHMKVPWPMDTSGNTVRGVPVAPGITQEDKGLLVDTSITNNRQDRFLANAAAGAAAKTRTKEKQDHYRHKFDASRFTLFPFVAEFDGTLCEPAHALMNAAAHHQSVQSEGAWLKSECIRSWRQSVSITLQQVISLTVLRTMRKSVQRPGEDPPDGRAHMKVKLLWPSQVDVAPND